MCRRSLIIVYVSLLTIVVGDPGYSDSNRGTDEPPNLSKYDEGPKSTEARNLESPQEEQQFLRHNVYRRHYFPDMNLGGPQPHYRRPAPPAHFRDMSYHPHRRGPAPPPNYGGPTYYGGPPHYGGAPHHGGPPHHEGPHHHGGPPHHWGPPDHWGPPHHGGPPHHHGGPSHHHGGPPHHHGGPPHHHGGSDHHDGPPPHCDDELTPSTEHNKDHESHETSTYPNKDGSSQATGTTPGGYTSAGTSTTEPDFNIDIRFGEDTKEVPVYDQSTKNNILSSIETQQPIQVVTV